MDDHFDTATYVDAASDLIGLKIAPAHRPGVIANMDRITGLARLVMEFPLSDEDEPVTVFRP